MNDPKLHKISHTLQVLLNIGLICCVVAIEWELDDINTRLDNPPVNSAEYGKIMEQMVVATRDNTEAIDLNLQLSIGNTRRMNALLESKTKGVENTVHGRAILSHIAQSKHLVNRLEEYRNGR